MCEFDNLAMLNSCEMCESLREKAPKEIDSESEEAKEDVDIAQIECPNKDCKVMNAIINEKCYKCKRSIFSDESEDEKKADSKKKPSPTLPCRKCYFDNNPDNKFCVNCGKKFLPARILGKSLGAKAPKARKAVRRYGVVDCPKCGSQLRIIDYTTNEPDICMTC